MYGCSIFIQVCLVCIWSLRLLKVTNMKCNFTDVLYHSYELTVENGADMDRNLVTVNVSRCKWVVYLSHTLIFM